jgi:hypothetical protein
MLLLSAFLRLNRMRIEEKQRKSSLEAENHKSEQKNLKQTSKNFERLQIEGNTTSEKNRSPKQQFQVMY